MRLGLNCSLMWKPSNSKVRSWADWSPSRFCLNKGQLAACSFNPFEQGADFINATLKKGSVVAGTDNFLSVKRAEGNGYDRAVFKALNYIHDRIYYRKASI